MLDGTTLLVAGVIAVLWLTGLLRRPRCEVWEVMLHERGNLNADISTYFTVFTNPGVSLPRSTDTQARRLGSVRVASNLRLIEGNTARWYVISRYGTVRGEVMHLCAMEMHGCLRYSPGTVRHMLRNAFSPLRAVGASLVFAGALAVAIGRNYSPAFALVVVGPLATGVSLLLWRWSVGARTRQAQRLLDNTLIQAGPGSEASSFN